MSRLRRHSGDLPGRFLRLDQFWSRETALILSLALGVGVGAGLCAVAFVQVTAFLSQVFFEGSAKALGLRSGAYIVLPTGAGLIVGLILRLLAPDSQRRGIPEVLTAISARNGYLRPVVVLSQAIGTALMIGAGGSVGREGPVVQINSLLGSAASRILKLDEKWAIHLVASGAAGGIAALFNAPLAGMAFALEVVLGDFAAQTFPMILVSSLAASVASRVVLGDSPAFALPAFRFWSWWELILYLGLGAMAGLCATAMLKALELVENAFASAKLPWVLRPAAGGLAVGLLGFFVPQVFGIGLSTIEKILRGDFALTVLAIILTGKILAVALTLGSGSPGGVMLPALFVGAALGSAYGQVAHSVLPDIASSSSAYALMGMVAVFAAGARAPITASLLLFEMTHDAHVFPPLLVAIIVSTIVTRPFESASLYTLNLHLDKSGGLGRSKTPGRHGQGSEPHRGPPNADV